METRLTQKQKTFALNIFNGMTQREAWKEAGYSTRYPIAHIDRDASLLANSPKIFQRLQELNKRTEDASVMNVMERKQVLTVIGRARLTDFMTAGADGSWVDIGPENPHSGALQEITSRTEYDDKGAGAAVITRIKLHSPLQAVDLLNKMDKLYSDGAFIQNNIDRQLNVFVVDNATRDLISQVGERTKLINNGHENNQSIQGDPRGMGPGQETD
ncbi:MAG TPA: terminase small subunit [Dehalococcoidia bacterium]|nr:terminase small subunit [Dehalococcoidia bacterium]